MTDLTSRQAHELVQHLGGAEVSARELLDAHVRRHEQVHGSINAVVATDLESAHRRAREIDDARARGEALGPLAGLPMTVKDGFDVAGLPATAGNPSFARRDAHCADADLVARLRAAGAIVWGKTNVPLMLGDFQTFNAVYGTTNNPYDLTRTPGGSSGGAAAALAAGITPLELGSDIGGSLRHPANWCGVYSLKPTWNTLSLRGHIPPPPGAYVEQDLAVPGPMARSAGDLRLLYDTLTAASPSTPKGIAGARIAVWVDEPGFPVSSETRVAVERAAEALREEGAQIEVASPPFSGAELLDNFLRLLYPILGSGFPDGVYRALERSRGEQADPYGGAMLATHATASYRSVAHAMATRQALKDALAEWFAGWDAILTPISAVTAFTHRQEGQLTGRVIEVDGHPEPYPHLFDWIAPATNLHAPAVAVPVTRTAAGLPVGVQIVGPWHAEHRLLDFADALEARTGGFVPPPLT